MKPKHKVKLAPDTYTAHVKSVETTVTGLQLSLDIQGLPLPTPPVMHITRPLPLNNNDAVVDLRKVQWATLYYVNQHGDKRRTKPFMLSVYGDIVYPDTKVFGTSETMLDYAKRKGLLDVWTPVCTLHITANRKLRYVGDKAFSVWDAWKALIFGGKK